MSTPTTTPPTRNASSVAGALKFFEIMAFVVGVGLLVLVGIWRAVLETWLKAVRS